MVVNMDDERVHKVVIIHLMFPFLFSIIIILLL